jgi:hypothetical protein
MDRTRKEKLVRKIAGRLTERVDKRVRVIRELSIVLRVDRILSIYTFSACLRAILKFEHSSSRVKCKGRGYSFSLLS